ncbi:MAG: YidC/Oxa1 family membrane protein insertase [Acidimicrobiales bacterium]|jgi:YidC/Oxa1 family membrane protein insertase
MNEQTIYSVFAAENSIVHAVGAFFHPIFILIGLVLSAIYSVVPNYALAIAILTILIMAVLTPLTVKSTKSMIAMQRLQPEMKRLQQKYKGAENREQLNQELMKLYKESGTSPVGSCLPTFLQMPFLFILYNVIKGLSDTSIKTINGHHVVVASPNYIPRTSKLYESLVASHGKMVSFGMNIALKPFSHHSSILQAVPFFALVVVAVLLQYFQMKQMNGRNPQAMQANPQMQTMQKIMPVLFAYIYFIVPAAVTIYMVISSAIRILTQDVMFRTGMVTPVGAPREIQRGEKVGTGQQKSLGSGGDKSSGEKGEDAGEKPANSGSSSGTTEKPVGEKKQSGATTGNNTTGSNTTGNKQRGGARGQARGQSVRGGSKKDAADAGGDSGDRAKPHPRSRDKRERKAR